MNKYQPLHLNLKSSANSVFHNNKSQQMVENKRALNIMSSINNRQPQTTLKINQSKYYCRSQNNSYATSSSKKIKMVSTINKNNSLYEVKSTIKKLQGKSLKIKTQSTDIQIQNNIKSNDFFKSPELIDQQNYTSSSNLIRQKLNHIVSMSQASKLMDRITYALSYSKQTQNIYDFRKTSIAQEKQKKTKIQTKALSIENPQSSLQVKGIKWSLLYTKQQQSTPINKLLQDQQQLPTKYFRKQ